MWKGKEANVLPKVTKGREGIVKGFTQREHKVLEAGREGGCGNSDFEKELGERRS